MTFFNPQDRIYRYLDSVGDGSGDTSATGDYSGSAARFQFKNPSRAAIINRMIIYIEDANGMQAQEYGNLGAALTNGILVSVEDASSTNILDLTGGIAIKSNGAWARTCYDADVKGWGAGNDALVVRWTFSRAGIPVYLPEGYSIGVDLNDSFVGLVDHTFMVQGYYYSGAVS